MVRLAKILAGAMALAVLLLFFYVGYWRVLVPLGIVAVTAALVGYWLAAIVDLLRGGPGGHGLWWAGTLTVVVVLGPLGALAYRLAAVRFDRDGTSEESPVGR